MESGLTFYYVEFDRIKIRIMYLLPDTKEFYGIAVS